jgi:hypothetical protein
MSIKVMEVMGGMVVWSKKDEVCPGGMLVFSTLLMDVAI